MPKEQVLKPKSGFDYYVIKFTDDSYLRDYGKEKHDYITTEDPGNALDIHDLTDAQKLIDIRGFNAEVVRFVVLTIITEIPV